MKFYHFLLLFIILSNSCKDRADYEISLWNQEKFQIDSLINHIKNVEYNDVYEMAESASKLLEFKNSERAQIYGQAYCYKAEFHLYDNEETIKNLEGVYELLQGEEYLELRMEIDLLLIDYYYLGNFYKQAGDRLDLIIDYIFNPEFEVVREVFINGIVTRIVHIDKEERIGNLKMILTHLSDEPWSYMKSRAHQSIALCYYYLNDVDKCKEELEFCLAKDLEHRIANQAIEGLMFLGSIPKETNTIQYIDQAIELSKESGHTKLLYMLYRNRGHQYFDLKEYDAAEQSYRLAIEAEYYHPMSEPVAIDYAYLGYALFSKNNNDNFDEAIELINKAIDIADEKNDLISKKTAITRKIWVLRHMGFHKEKDNLYAELKAIEEEDKRKDLAVEDFYFNSRLKLLSRDKKIELLDKNVQLQSNLVLRQRIILGFSMISILLLGAFLYYFRQKLKIGRELKKRNLVIESQLEQIELANQSLKLKNEEQKIDLKEKLLLLSENLEVINAVTQKIVNSSEISINERRKLISLLESKNNKRIVKEIDLRFAKLHENFFKELSKRHPKLTGNNLYLCAYLKMNLSSKEIASLQFKSTESIKVSRSRLRKKLGLDNTISLQSYLNSI